MNKKWTFVSLSLALFGTNSFCGTYFDAYPNWNGFYIGGNIGYLWSANNTLVSTGQSTYANPLFLPSSQQMAASLAALGTNRIFNSSKGFIGGGQIGYNSHFSERMVIGLDTDLDALGQSNGTSSTVRSVSTPLVGTHNADVTITKKLNYLGLLKGRLGYLVTPTFLLYGSGAFAYGGGSLKTSYSVTQTNPVFLPISEQSDANKVLAGWAAGGGGEWLFSPCWSLKLEYIYYELGPLHSILELAQPIRTNPVTTYAKAVSKSSARFAENTLRIGVNYHFS